MKNVSANSLKTCIFLDESEFKDVLSEIFSEEITVNCDYDGISVERNSVPVPSDELFWKLEEHFGVAHITSMHIDDCDTVGIWIAYKDHDATLLPHLTTNDIAELKGQVVDIFEDFAAENEIYIPNEDREAEIAEAAAEGIPADELGLAIIYGDDYDRIASIIESAIQIKNGNYDRSFFTDNEIEYLISDTCDAFAAVANYQFADERRNELSHRLKNTLTNWGLLKCPVIQIPN